MAVDLLGDEALQHQTIERRPPDCHRETGFDEATFDLISVQYRALKAGHDYGQNVRDARNAGEDEIADFFEQLMADDAKRAHRWHDFLVRLGGTDNTSPQF